MKYLAALLALVPAISYADCAPVAKVMEVLEGQFREQSTGFGIIEDTQGNAAILETLANPETGTWTVVIHRPDGLSCVMASGEGWQMAEKGQRS